MDFSAITLQARKEYHDIFKLLKKKSATKKILSSEAVIQNRRKNKEFLKQTKVKAIHPTKPALQKILKGTP